MTEFSYHIKWVFLCLNSGTQKQEGLATFITIYEHIFNLGSSALFKNWNVNYNSVYRKIS